MKDEEHAADLVVQNARERAERVLRLARAREDAELPAGEVAPEAKRERADAVLADEQAQADAQAADLRLEQRAVMADLLRAERERTNDMLESERRGSEVATAALRDALPMVGHELRNLLDGVSITAALLVTKQAGAAPGTIELADRIVRLCGRMRRLLHDLVEAGAIDAQQVLVDPAVGDLRPVIAEAADGVCAAAQAADIAVEVCVGDKPPSAFFDADRVLQICTNLLVNALRYTPAGGVVNLTAAVPGGDVEISVVDSGPDVPVHEQAHIFEHFVRGRPGVPAWDWVSTSRDGWWRRSAGPSGWRAIRAGAPAAPSTSPCRVRLATARRWRGLDQARESAAAAAAHPARLPTSRGKSLRSERRPLPS